MLSIIFFKEKKTQKHLNTCTEHPKYIHKTTKHNAYFRKNSVSLFEAWNVRTK